MSGKKSRRISPSSAYIGAGNKTSVFSRKGRKPFQELNDIYQKEVNKLKDEKHLAEHSELSEEEKKIIRDRIKAQARKSSKKSLIVMGITLIGTLIVMGLIVFMVKLVFF